MPTAVVIDGAYFLRRFKHRYPTLDPADPNQVGLGVLWLAASHLTQASHEAMPEYEPLAGGGMTLNQDWLESRELYKIFFYDCPPLSKKIQYPVSKRSLDLTKTAPATARLLIHEKLQSLRKVALRLGWLNDGFDWRPKPDAVKRWIKEPTQFQPHDDDFEINTIQKGVDMRLGLDVASMAYKRQVDRIILVAADGDFVPAVKLARREGIDVVLDSMGGVAAKDLIANVDGVRDIPRAKTS